MNFKLHWYFYSDKTLAFLHNNLFKSSDLLATSAINIDKRQNEGLSNFSFHNINGNPKLSRGIDYEYVMKF